MIGTVLLFLVVGQNADPAPPLYPSSVVGTDFDFIRESDISLWEQATFLKKGAAEMPDKTGEGELFLEAFQFESTYRDEVKVHFAVHHRVGSEAESNKYVEQAGIRLGRIPHVLRRGVERVVINVGDATAFSDRGLIVLYTENMAKRISTHDLEETIFHESVHATGDAEHAGSRGWKAAQESDPGFVTDYASRLPAGEDLTESAFFAVTLVHHPERLPQDVAERLRRQIPARITYIERLFPQAAPWNGSFGHLN
ncbi:MAG: hypothetical protein KF812_01485 [Fimbriimonadaceae bacterium]|nr:hypothetical protein [Fimbriimonadaceae bacterium]